MLEVCFTYLVGCSGRLLGFIWFLPAMDHAVLIRRNEQSRRGRRVDVLPVRSAHFLSCWWSHNPYSRFQNFDTAHSKLVNHWDTWITENDFQTMKAAGLNHVRLPIGYWAYDISHGQWGLHTRDVCFIDIGGRRALSPRSSRLPESVRDTLYLQ